MRISQPTHSNFSPGPRLPAVDRAFDLLELLIYSTEELTLSEVSRRLGIAKSSAHYLISTLVARGYLQRSQDRHHYSLGLRVSELAKLRNAESQVRTICCPYLESIVRKLDLTTLMAVLRGAEAVTIAAVESTYDRGGGAWIGRHVDVHCTAQGKALIAYHPDKDLEKLLGNRELAVFTPKTIRTLEALKASLAEVRTRGFATNDEEHALGVRAVAAPIVNHTRTVIASVSLRAPASRMPMEAMARIGEELVPVTREISRQISD